MSELRVILRELDIGASTEKPFSEVSPGKCARITLVEIPKKIDKTYLNDKDKDKKHVYIYICIYV